MNFVELITSFSPLRFVSDWRRENTERENNRLQAMLKKAEIESAEQQNFRQIELAVKQEQFETVRLAIKEKLLTKQTLKDVLSLVAEENEVHHLGENHFSTSKPDECNTTVKLLPNSPQ